MLVCGKHRSKFALTHFVRFGLFTEIHSSDEIFRFGSEAVVEGPPRCVRCLSQTGNSVLG